MSVDPAAVSVIEATFWYLSAPPVIVGTLGTVWSSLAVPPGATADHGDMRPTPSTARNSTSVVPCAVTLTVPPAVAADQVEPPFVEVRYW